MLNREDITEYCHECDRSVIIVQHRSMDYVQWVCSECGTIVDSYPEYDDYYVDNGDLYE